MAKFLKVATTSELALGQTKKVEVDGKVIALFNLEGSYHAIDDACPHRGGPLSGGPTDGEVVTCPWHGSKFNVKSGDVLTPPARTGVSSYRVRVSGSDIEIELEI
jgi:nitrite reductase/ring-hydroxylating ferredoxin subunit